MFVQVCDQAAGGFGVLCGGHPQQWARCAGDYGKQAEPRTPETYAGAEHPQTGRAVIYYTSFNLLFAFLHSEMSTHRTNDST